MTTHPTSRTSTDSGAASSADSRRSGSEDTSIQVDAPEEAEREAFIQAACLENENDLFPNGDWVHPPSLHRHALDQLRAEIESIRREWKSAEGFSPIEHIKTRIKEPASILDKLDRLELEHTASNVAEHVHDLAGMRIVFAFVTDIYLLLERIGRSSDLKILWIRDYIMQPKPNGYRSLHVLLSVPVQIEEATCRVRIEVQMRTLAMDFWASLEHILLYKYDRRVPEHLEQELASAAGAAGELDHKMLALRSEVLSLSEEDEPDQK
ncbi:GTP pyrophosphokinase family protein [Saccharibacillus sp. JS10]|uniref:GTP pyrophosphokinase n=1 Tax=Saccharibacillus sp. JS10 TaxID=2950552 RepID=UPI00210ABB2B|nr:GTP pyrophosphokinase family protein [Saccharibacillus sp. JS10]MCQ4087366.1 GTP pyrophosphokinase family protein [Saccharibacillus sp. JS10]